MSAIVSLFMALWTQFLIVLSGLWTLVRIIWVSICSLFGASGTIAPRRPSRRWQSSRAQELRP